MLGGESSGGLTVRGHIAGKDSVYAAALFVEAVCALNKCPSQIMDELYAKLGRHVMLEESLTFTPEGKAMIQQDLMASRNLPVFDTPVDRVSYEDGCKVYFNDDSFAVCRFSGTEPLVRLCAEASGEQQAQEYMTIFKQHIDMLIRP